MPAESQRAWGAPAFPVVRLCYNAHRTERITDKARLTLGRVGIPGKLGPRSSFVLAQAPEDVADAK